jgi:Flp pilus assembly protein protease CpaA
MTTTSRAPASSPVDASSPASVRTPLFDVSAVAMCTVLAIVAGSCAWWFSGAAVAVPLALVGGVAVAAAIEDHRSGRIPNSLVLTGVVVLACACGFVASLDNRLMRPLTVDMAAGFVLSGAPLLFAVWFVAPRLVGGGDWKLLAVLGIAVGALAPTAATLVPMAGFGAALVPVAIHRRRHVRLGPFLAIGYGTAIAAAVLAPELFGNAYTTIGAT